MFHYAWISTVMLIVYLIIEHIASGRYSFQLFSYSLSQYLQLLAAMMLNAVGMNCVTIAYQAEKSSFVSLMGTITVFYGFLIDFFFFGVSYTPQ